MTDIIEGAAIKIADLAKATARGQSPRLNPESASLIWANTYQAARAALADAYEAGLTSARH